MKLELPIAHLELTETQDKNSTRYSYGDDDDSEDEEQSCSRKTLAGMLSRYQIMKRLPSNQWHDLGVFGDPSGIVRLQITHVNHQHGDDKQEGSNKYSQVSCTTFRFRSTVEGANDAFISIAYQWYLDELRRLEDHSRYYYEL